MTLTAIPRVVSLSVVSVTAIGFFVAIGPAPSANATPCSAPEANVDPPAAPPPMPAPQPVVQPPTGRRPSHANDQAPLPKLGPLISSLLKPGAGGQRYSAPIQPQAGVVPPPGPNPPAPGIPQPPNANQLQPNAAPVPPQPAPPPPASIAGAPTSLVDWVTGTDGPNKTLQRFGISGTDLGIVWDNGDPANRQVLMAFGDTFGYCKVHGQQWRYNVLFRSSDHDLSHGIHIADGVPNDRYSGSPVWTTGLSKQVVNTIHKAPHETGIIPTAAISLGRTQYMSYMSIRQWGRDGDWQTNYSAIARSVDNGQNWGIFPSTIRTASADAIPGVGFTPGNENFQMSAFMKGTDGYLYQFGTPSGRGGAAFLSRVPRTICRTSASTSTGMAIKGGAGSRPIRGRQRRSSRARWVRCRPSTTAISSSTWCCTPTVAATTSWQGPRRRRKDRGAGSSRSCRHSRCPVASMRR